MVMTTSARAAAILAVSTPVPPAAFSFSTAAWLRSTPSTVWPALIRFCAIGNPMLPSPMKPIRAIAPSPFYLRMTLSENRFPSPVEPGTGFFGIMRARPRSNPHAGCSCAAFNASHR